MTEQEQLITHRFLMCTLVFRNVQREGPVKNLTLDEQRRATPHKTSTGEVMIYKVWNHKTSGQFGSANIVLPLEIHDIISAYIDKHWPIPKDEFTQLVFLTPGGRQVVLISEDLSALSRDFPTEHGRLNVTAKEMRKMTVTDFARKGAGDAMIREIATHMSHSEATARRYYQWLEGEEGSVRVYGSFSGKRPDEEPAQLAPLPKKG